MCMHFIIFMYLFFFIVLSFLSKFYNIYMLCVFYAWKYILLCIVFTWHFLIKLLHRQKINKCVNALVLINLINKQFIPKNNKTKTKPKWLPCGAIYESYTRHGWLATFQMTQWWCRPTWLNIVPHHFSSPRSSFSPLFLPTWQPT